MPAFSNEGALRAFDTFQKLDENIQVKVLQLLREDRLNNCGGFKRPPNAWLIFRSDALAAPEANAFSQSELTVRCKTQWERLSAPQKKDLQNRAQLAYNELLGFFPDYCYKPMPATDKARWRRLSATQRKEFWLASAVRIAERIISPKGTWDGFLRFDQWMNKDVDVIWSPSDRSPKETSLITSSVARQTLIPSPQVGLRHNHPRFQQETHVDSESSSCSPSASATRKLAHPYERALDARAHMKTSLRRKEDEVTSPPEWLNGVLVAIGPHEPGGKPRQLVLSMFQRKGPVIWVEDEIEDAIPEDVLQSLPQTQPNNTSPDNIILRGYSNPRIPPSVNEHGELLVPRLEHVSQYHEYMAAYHTATAAGSEFLWNPTSAPAPQNPLDDAEQPTRLELATPLEQISGAVTSSIKGLPLTKLLTAATHDAYMSSPYSASAIHPEYTGLFNEAGRMGENIDRTTTSQTQPYQLNDSVQATQAGDFSAIHAFDTTGRDNFNTHPSTRDGPSTSPYDVSTDMTWDSFLTLAVGAK